MRDVRTVRREVCANLSKKFDKAAFSYSTGRAKLSCQFYSIPQYENFKLSASYTGTPKWGNGVGGICALAVNNLCDLRGGKLNVENKGTGAAVFNENANSHYMKDRLPIGTGHGTVFLMSKTLKMDTATRIGATYSGTPTTGYKNYGGVRGAEALGSRQGAHVFIVANKIEGMNDAAISTGGDGAGAGYGSSGGVSGSAFIYCNDTG